MKYLLYLIALFLIPSSLSAQGFAAQGLANPGYMVVPLPARDSMPRYVNDKCRATRIGTAVMIVGGVVALGGGIAVASPWAQDQSYVVSHNRISTASYIAVGGVSLGVVGIIIHVVGQEYDDKHVRRVFIYTDQDRLGLAWRL